MDNEVVFTFYRDSEELTVGANAFGIIKYSGLEATDYALETMPNGNGIGASLTKRRLLPRDLSLEFEYKIRRQDSGIRQRLIGFFSPFSCGRLNVRYKGVVREIEYEVEKMRLPTVNVNERLRCCLDLQCMNPFFTGVQKRRVTLATWVDGWRWKFTLPFHMKRRGSFRRNVYNAGHSDTPVQIIFKGPAVNPAVKNLTTGEMIRIRKELTTDDVLYICTEFGAKTVRIDHSDGQQEDAFDYIDLNSRFWWLQTGDNMVEYETDNDLEPQSVTIEYDERYLGV